MRVLGSTVVDGFPERLAARLRPGCMELVALPPGRDPGAYVTALAGALAGRLGEATVDLGAFTGADSTNSFRTRLALHLGWSEVADSLEGMLLANVASCGYPRTVTLTLDTTVPLEIASSIASSSMALANATRDLEGPLKVVICTLPGVVIPGLAPSVVAPPALLCLEPWHVDGDKGRVEACAEAYLALRVYWEAAGQPERMAELERTVERMVPSMTGRAPFDVDTEIDRRFDDYDDAPAGVLNCWRSELSALLSCPGAEQSLRSGRVVSAVPDPWRLLASGFAWCPPYSRHLMVTPQAAAALDRLGTLPKGMPNLRSAARQNSLLSTWALGLTAVVERGLASHCGQWTDLPARLRQLGLVEQLETERARAEAGLSYAPATDLLAYAAFGQLVALLDGGRGAGLLPVPLEHLHKVRIVRNCCAHLRTANWRGVRVVAEAIERLGA